MCEWEREIYRDANWKIIGLLEYVEKEKQATERAKEEKKKRLHNLQKESENGWNDVTSDVNLSRSVWFYLNRIDFMQQMCALSI